MKGVPTIIAVGEPFGRLTVTGPAFTETMTSEFGTRKIRCYPCICECGTRKAIPAKVLANGTTRSCGCLRKETSTLTFLTHGGTYTRIYYLFNNMKARCYRENGDDYKDYGGRGITVCDEWKTDFAAFREWAMSHGYRDNLTIERKDVNGNYSPGNCEFIPMEQQQRNKRNSRLVEYQGETKTHTEWGRDPRCAVECKTFCRRMLRGWDFQKAFTIPVHSPNMCNV